MAFIFHIIYAPGTVRDLSFFLESLLGWSDCSFRLVANGCQQHERQHLRQLCAQRPRLEFVELPTGQLMEHGLALDYLQTLNREEFFCFMDSDIYATGEFLSEFTPHLRRHVGIFSCSPIWCRAEERILPATERYMAGRYNQSATGLCLGGTFFAIYDNRTLTYFRQSTGIGFERYRWQDIPVAYQDLLRTMGLQKEWYDTGKVLNLGLLRQGQSLAFVDSRRLYHLGGLSELAVQSLSPGQPRHLRGSAPNSPEPLSRKLRRKLKPLLAAHFPALYERLVAARLHPSPMAKRRFVYSSYFAYLLTALSKNTALPVLPVRGEPDIEQRIAAATAQIIELHRRREKV